jgi:hypothetical protein
VRLEHHALLIPIEVEEVGGEIWSDQRTAEGWAQTIGISARRFDLDDFGAEGREEVRGVGGDAAARLDDSQG